MEELTDFIERNPDPRELKRASLNMDSRDLREKTLKEG